MTTGDQPAFPGIQQTPFKPGYLPSESAIPGMTYRLWLIGQIAGPVLSGLLSTPAKSFQGEDIHGATSKVVVDLADAIIARLDKERGER